MFEDLQMHPKSIEIGSWHFQQNRNSATNHLQTRQRIRFSSSISDSFDLPLPDRQGHYERKGARKAS
jgi:hypothetical protein